MWMGDVCFQKVQSPRLNEFSIRFSPAGEDSDPRMENERRIIWGNRGLDDFSLV